MNSILVFFDPDIQQLLHRIMNLDFFLPAREDYMHLVKYLEEE